MHWQAIGYFSLKWVDRRITCTIESPNSETTLHASDRILNFLPHVEHITQAFEIASRFKAPIWRLTSCSTRSVDIRVSNTRWLTSLLRILARNHFEHMNLRHSRS